MDGLFHLAGELENNILASGARKIIITRELPSPEELNKDRRSNGDFPPISVDFYAEYHISDSEVIPEKEYFSRVFSNILNVVDMGNGKIWYEPNDVRPVSDEALYLLWFQVLSRKQIIDGLNLQLNKQLSTFYFENEIVDFNDTRKCLFGFDVNGVKLPRDTQDILDYAKENGIEHEAYFPINFSKRECEGDRKGQCGDMVKAPAISRVRLI